MAAEDEDDFDEDDGDIGHSASSVSDSPRKQSGIPVKTRTPQVRVRCWCGLTIEPHGAHDAHRTRPTCRVTRTTREQP